MLPIVARLATGTEATPAPWNSTNLPTTPWWRSISVMVRTRSVAVAPSGSSPVSRNPSTFGLSIDPTHAPAQHAKAVLHGGVGVGAHAGVGVGADADPFRTPRGPGVPDH